MYGSSRAKVKVSPRSIFSFAWLSYIASILFTRVNLRTYARKNYATVAIHPNRRYILMVFNQEKAVKHNYLFITAWFTFETSLTDFASLLSPRRM